MTDQYQLVKKIERLEVQLTWACITIFFLFMLVALLFTNYVWLPDHSPQIYDVDQMNSS